jgi:hypothetical protein
LQQAKQGKSPVAKRALKKVSINTLFSIVARGRLRLGAPNVQDASFDQIYLLERKNENVKTA